MSAQTFVAKPVEIQAVQWKGDIQDIPAAWRELDAFTITEDGSGLEVRTKRGLTPVFLDDWIVFNRAREFYPVDPATFADKYEAVP